MSGFDWRAVVFRDFDLELDEPGRRSGQALDMLLADLGSDGEPAPTGYGEWVDRLEQAAMAGPSALLDRLDHPDVPVRRALSVVLAYLDAPAEDVFPTVRRRIGREDDDPARLGLLVALGRFATDDGVRNHLRERLRGGPVDALGAAIGLLLGGDTGEELIDGLVLCGGPAGAALGELAWADPEWTGRAPHGPVYTVASWLEGSARFGWTVPSELRARWLTRMMAGLWTGQVPAPAAYPLVDAAERLLRTDRERHADQAAAVTALLRHPDDEIRPAALSRSGLLADGHYADAVVAALDDPVLCDRALAMLAERNDPRCLPHVRRRIRRGAKGAGKLLYSMHRFAGELWPDVRARLAEDPPPAEAAALIGGLDRLRVTGPFEPDEVIALLERLARRIGATVQPDKDDLDAATAACAFLREHALSDERAVTALRRVAEGPDLELGLAAVRALMGLGERSDGPVIRLLLDVIDRYPPRIGRPGREAGRYGWRFDCNACSWLGELGPRAAVAAPVMRALFTDGGEAGELRRTAAFAYWRITGEPDEVLPVLIGQIPHNPVNALYDLELMGAAARPALPVLDELAAGEGDPAQRAHKTAARIRDPRQPASRSR